MDMAERKGVDPRRVLVSAEYFNERAIFLESFQVKTPCSRSRASLSRVTLAVQFPGEDAFVLSLNRCSFALLNPFC